MANIKTHLDKIKNALFGQEVRGSIHDGIDAINKEVEGTTEKQNKLGEQFKNLVINEGNSNAEVAASRGSHDWLPDRLDNFDSQLEQNMNKINEQFNTIESEKATKNEMDIERKRIDNFTRLEEGSTTGDAELTDARISANGLIYDNIGSAIRTQIGRLSDVLEKYVYSDNLIIEQGQETVSENWNTTNFIPIKQGNLYTVKNKASRVNYYGIDKKYISSGSNDVTSFTTPSNAYFVRLSWYSEDFPKLILIDGIEENRKLSLLQANAGNVTIQSGKNRFNKYNLLEGKKYISSNGDINSTHYEIYVSKPFPIVRFGNEKYVTLSTTGILKDNLGYLFLNENLIVIENGIYNNSSSQTIEIPLNAKYMQVTYSCVIGEESSDLQVEYGKIATTFENYKSEFSVEEINELVNKVIKSYDIRKVVEIKPTSNILDFYKSMVDAYIEGNCDVYVRSGNYLYTNEMIDFIRSEGKRGVPIGNNCKYYFDSDAYIYCEYTGDNAQDVGSYFSPLDSWNTSGSWELHNLNLISKNTLYALHDECSGQPKKYTHLFDNCSIILDNTNASFTAYNRAIGGGLGGNGEIIHRNCYYEATSNNTIDVSYHGIETGDTSNLVFTNCYFAHTLGIDAPSGNSNKRLIFSGNSILTDIVRNDIDFRESWNILSYANEIRN